MVDEENGCVRYLPGSHREGMRPHRRTNVLGFSQGMSNYGTEDCAREVPVCAEPGDLFGDPGQASRLIGDFDTYTDQQT